MAEFLSEINIGKKVIEPILNVFKKKKNKSKMLEEQIRDTLPCDVSLPFTMSSKLCQYLVTLQTLIVLAIGKLFSIFYCLVMICTIIIVHMYIF